MSRHRPTILAVTLLAAATLSACSSESPIAPTASSDAIGEVSDLSVGTTQAAVPGVYELSFLTYVNGTLQPVSTLFACPVPTLGCQALILGAHVEDAGSGAPAQRGMVTFEYCSYRGLPPNDLSRPDEAPLEACDVDGTGSWARLGSASVDQNGNAYWDFGIVRIPRTVGFRFRYTGQGSGIANDVSPAENFTWVAPAV